MQKSIHNMNLMTNSLAAFQVFIRRIVCSRILALLAVVVELMGWGSPASAHIWFTKGAGTLDFGTAGNCSSSQLPSVSGTGNAFIGASGGPGGIAHVVTGGSAEAALAELWCPPGRVEIFTT
jgi:hypothetical protein